MAPTTPDRPTRSEWLTPKRAEVLALSQHLNLPASKIKPLTGVPTPTIRRWIKINQPRHVTKPRSGRPPKLNARDIRRLVRAVTSSQDGRQASFMKLAKDLNIKASVETIRKALRKAGFRRCVACPKPLVSWENRKKRLKWAKAHLHWTVEDWHRIIFTDESTFETGQRAKTWVTRRPGERYCPDCMIKFKHSGQQSVMVWGGICGDQASELIEFRATLKRNRKGEMKTSISSTDYINQILEPWVEGWYKALAAQGRRPILMEDGASIHSSKECVL